jgi:hypothetical protein
LLAHAHLEGRLFDESGPLVRGIQVEGIDMKAVRAGGQQIHFQQIVAGVLGQAAHTVAAVCERDDDLLCADLHRHIRRGPQQRRLSG